MIIGNLTRDPEVRTTPGGQSVANFGVATSSQWTDASGQRQERVEYHSIVAWGKLADICGQYLGKGRKVYVEGRLQTREWEAQDGSKRNRTEIVAENMIMLDRAPAGQGSGTPVATPVATPGEPTVTPIASTPATPAVDKGIDDDEIRIEDVPF